MKVWILAIGALLALVAVLAMASWAETFGFDGNVFEPGCDWGNKHCEVEDYRDMCADFEGSVHDARYVRYCKP